MLDVSHFGDFKANEISVRLLENQVEITGKQNWRPHPGGSVRREFAQRHVVPRDINVEALHAYMTREGMLIIKAPRISLNGTNGHPQTTLKQVIGVGEMAAKLGIAPPPKTRSIHKDVLFRDVTGVYPTN